MGKRWSFISLSFGLLIIINGLIMVIPTPDESIPFVFPEDVTALITQECRNEIIDIATTDLMSNYFIENKGQLPEADHLFYSYDGDIHFLPDGILMRFRELDPIYGEDESPNLDPKENEIPESFHEWGVVIKYSFVDSNKITPEGRERCPWNTNYFKGSDPDKWYSDVPNYMEITYPGIWDGIDIVYRLKDGAVKYDIILAHGADPSMIRFRVEGCNDLDIDEIGNLVIETDYNDIMDSKPVAFYGDEINKEIKVDFKIIGEDTVGFDIEDYDLGRSIVIDPLTYSTYLGGLGNDMCADMEVDSSGDAYVIGHTTSTDFPNTTGAYDNTYNSDIDIFVTKLNSDGSSLLYSTFLGSSYRDSGNDIEIDSNGCAFITGYASDDTVAYPTTSGAYSTSHSGSNDIIVTKLNSDGSDLLYSTFIGSSYAEIGYGIKVDSDGNAYVIGSSTGSDYPTTEGAYDTSFNGDGEVVVSKLNATGSSLIFSTYVGGIYSELGKDIEIDTKRNVYIAGTTSSENYPTTNSAYDKTLNGYGDAFVTKISSDGSSLVFSTFIGGSLNDELQDIELDSNNNVYLTGHTFSSNYPTTKGAYDTSHDQTYRDIFVTKLSSGGSSLVYSTFIGGNYEDYGHDIELDSRNLVYITGSVRSDDYPTTSDAYDATFGGNSDGFITKFSVDGSSLIYSSFFGEWYFDHGYGLALDKYENVHISGYTLGDFPTTNGSFDTTYNGNYDSFVMKFSRFVDHNPPSFDVDFTPFEGTTGDVFTFNTRIIDDVEVNDTYVEYWFGSGSSVESSLIFSSGTYIQSITIPPDSTDELHYIFHANDLEGNWNQTAEKIVQISDNDAPVFGMDSSSITASTGDQFYINIIVSDNIGVNRVNVEYWFGNGAGMVTEMSGSGTYSGSIEIPDLSLETLHYFFHAYDAEENWAKSNTIDIDVIDDDLPVFEEDRSDTDGTTGDEFKFKMDAVDNINIDGAWVEYWFDEDNHINSSMHYNDLLNLSIMIPANTISDLNYKFHFNDTSDNWNETPMKNVTIRDNDIPVFGVDERIYFENYYNVSISISAQDNIGLEKVWIEYWFDTHELFTVEEEMHIEQEMTYNGNNYSIDIDLQINSTKIDYIINTVDTSGLVNSTPQKSIMILDKIPPEIEYIDDITIYLGSELKIDVNVTDNIGVSSLVWEGDPSVVYGSGFINKPTKSGVFSVTLTAIDQSGNDASLTFIIRILPPDHDNDGDGIPDLIEKDLGLDMNSSYDASEDPDDDGLTNLQEYLNGTSMDDDDTDDDGMPDGWEVNNGLDALISSADNDADGDGKSDLEEYIAGTDPNVTESGGGDEEQEGNNWIWIAGVLALIVIIILVLGIVSFLFIKNKKSDNQDESPSGENGSITPESSGDDIPAENEIGGINSEDLTGEPIDPESSDSSIQEEMSAQPQSYDEKITYVEDPVSNPFPQETPPIDDQMAAEPPGILVDDPSISENNKTE